MLVTSASRTTETLLEGAGLFVSDADRASAFDVQSVYALPSYPAFGAEQISDAELASAVGTPVSATPTIPSSQDKSLLDYLGDIGENLLDSLKTTGEAAVRGAIEGATASSAGASAGAQVGASGTGISATALFAGVALLLLLRK